MYGESVARRNSQCARVFEGVDDQMRKQREEAEMILCVLETPQTAREPSWVCTTTVLSGIKRGDASFSKGCPVPRTWRGL